MVRSLLALIVLVAIPSISYAQQYGLGGSGLVGGRPDVGTGYVWSLGDLSSVATTRIPQIPDDSWADAYDTVAELEGLGWLTVDITAASCDAQTIGRGTLARMDAANGCTDLYDNDAVPQTTGSADGFCDADPTISVPAEGDLFWQYDDDGTGDCESAISSGYPTGASVVLCEYDAAGFAGATEWDLATATGDEDESAINTAFDTYCINTTDKECDGPSGDQNYAGVVFRLAANCTYDVTGGFNERFNNYAIFGQGGSEIRCNDTVSSTAQGTHSTSCVSNSDGGSSGFYNPSHSATFNVTAGSSEAQGTTDIIVNDCSTPDSGLGTLSIAAGDFVQLVGTNEDASQLDWGSKVVSVTGTPCTVVLENGLPTTFGTTVGLRTWSTNVSNFQANRRENLIYKNFKVGFPFMPRGACSGGGGGFCGSAMDLSGNNNVLVEDMDIGPCATGDCLGISNSVRVAVRGNKFDEVMNNRRGTHGSHLYVSSESYEVSLVNNIIGKGAPGFIRFEGEEAFTWVGFNYQEDQSVFTENTIGNLPDISGNYCNGGAVTVGANTFPTTPISTERAIFWHGGTDGHGDLIESNDFYCSIVGREGTGTTRYATLYRNILDTGSTSNAFIDVLINGSPWQYMNWWANRAYQFDAAGGGTRNTDFSFGYWNVQEDATPASFPAGTGVEWTETGKTNQDSTSGAYTLNSYSIPPSLVIRTGTPPSWWCQESGDWNSDWHFGSKDDGARTEGKLPSQIRAEGGTCTAP